MTDPQTAANGLGALLGELAAFGLAVTLMLTVGHGLLLTMDRGSSHRTGLDLLAAGSLLGLG